MPLTEEEEEGGMGPPREELKILGVAPEPVVTGEFGIRLLTGDAVCWRPV